MDGMKTHAILLFSAALALGGCATDDARLREIDEAGISARPDTAAMLCALEAQDGAAIGALLQNAFEPLVAARYPVVEALRSAMLNSGALGARLTGTGSVVFGLYRDRAAAAHGAQALRPLCPQVYLCTALCCT